MLSFKQYITENTDHTHISKHIRTLAKDLHNHEGDHAEKKIYHDSAKKWKEIGNHVAQGRHDQAKAAHKALDKNQKEDLHHMGDSSTRHHAKAMKYFNQSN